MRCRLFGIGHWVTLVYATHRRGSCSALVWRGKIVFPDNVFVTKGNVEGVNVEHLFLIFIYGYTTRGKHWCGHPSISTQNRLRLSTLFPCYPRLFLADTGNRIACLTRIAHTGIISVCNGGSYTTVRKRRRGPSERWEGCSTKVANAVLAFAFPPGSTLVARSDGSLHLRRKTR